MAKIIVKDRVKETTTTTGTGSLSLLGAVSGYQGFSAIGDGNITYYALYNPEDGSWEVGVGTYTASGTTLSRDTVISSSAAGAKIDLTAGTKDVFCTYPAERSIYEEPNGNVLIDDGPITIVGSGVTSYTSLNAALGEAYADVNSFAQFYLQNYNDGTDASTDFVVENNLGTDTAYYADFGINSSNFSSVDYPIYTPNSGYLYSIGDTGTPSTMFVGSGDGDVVLHAGGFTSGDVVATLAAADKSATFEADVNVGGDVNATGGTFTAPVTTTSSMVSPGSTEFVTKAYVDNAASVALTVHTAVYLETDDDGNLNATYDNGTAGVGATLTNAGTQAALTIDGVLTTVGDRILVNAQSDATENGVYVVSVVGDGSTNWVLTRSSDADTYGINSPNSLDEGSAFYVESGLTGAAQTYVCNTPGTITFGTTDITFALFSKVPAYNVVSPLDLTGATLSLAGVVDPTHGGTGVSTVTTGDLLYGSASNTWSKLAAGSAYKSLVMNAGGTNVEWNAVALNQSGAVSGSLGATNGGTGQSSYAVGDILYSGATDTLSKLSGNSTTTKKFLTQTGTGSGSAAPAWGTISGSDVTSAVSSATNVAGGAANQVVYQTGSGATGFVTAPTSSGTALTWNGSAFTWVSAGGASITDDTTTNATYYPVWANATSGTMSDAYVSSTKLNFNPSTGTLAATTFSGAWSGIPSGTVMLFVQTAAPTGWTKSATHNNKALRVVSGTASSGGSVAFTTAFASQTPAGSVSVSGTVGATTLTTAQIPAHSHTVSDPGHSHTVGVQNNFGYPNGSGGTRAGGALATSSATTGITIANAGGGGSHDHTFSGSGSFTGTAINLAVQYVDVIIATKD